MKSRPSYYRLTPEFLDALIDIDLDALPVPVMVSVMHTRHNGRHTLMPRTGRGFRALQRLAEAIDYHGEILCDTEEDIE